MSNIFASVCKCVDLRLAIQINQKTMMSQASSIEELQKEFLSEQQHIVNLVGKQTQKLPQDDRDTPESITYTHLYQEPSKQSPQQPNK